MSVQTIVMITHDKEVVGDVNNAIIGQGLVMPSFKPKEEANELIRFLSQLASGDRMGSMQVAVNSVNAAASSGTVTPTGVLAADTVTVAGIVLTAVSGTPSADQFQIGTDAVTAANLAAAINADATLSTYVVASAASNVVTITAATQAAIGNLITLASSNGTRLPLSGATLTGGAGNYAATTTYKYGV